MYVSVDTKNPLYSIPHFNLTTTGLPVRPFRNGLGFSGIAYKYERVIAMHTTLYMDHTHSHVHFFSQILAPTWIQRRSN